MGFKSVITETISQLDIDGFIEKAINSLSVGNSDNCLNCFPNLDFCLAERDSKVEVTLVTEDAINMTIVTDHKVAPTGENNGNVLVTNDYFFYGVFDIS